MNDSFADRIRFHVIAATMTLVLCGPVDALARQVTFPDVSGWTRVCDEPVYTPDNLWDIIDGAADLYLEYGFVDLHLARYTTPDSLELRAEVYRHDAPENAFGMYALERDPSNRFVTIGVQGYEQTGAVVFLTGPYYVKLTSNQSGDAVQGALRRLGTALADHLKQPGEWPPLLQVFPAEDRIPNAEQYVARNYLGRSFLSHVYVVRYSGSPEVRIVLIAAGSPTAADLMIEAYRKALPAGSVAEAGEGRLRIQDPNNGVLELLRHGRFLLGAPGSVPVEQRDRIWNAMRTRLPK